MNFNTTGQPRDFNSSDLIGNVYKCKGGNKTAYWIVVAVRDGTVICLGIDRDGNITSSVNYGVHVFCGYPWCREALGKVTDMIDLNFTISWNHLP